MCGTEGRTIGRDPRRGLRGIRQERLRRDPAGGRRGPGVRHQGHDLFLFRDQGARIRRDDPAQIPGFLPRTGKLCREIGGVIQLAPALAQRLRLPKDCRRQNFARDTSFPDRRRLPVSRPCGSALRSLCSRSSISSVGLSKPGFAAGEFRASPASAFTEIVMSPALLLSLWSMCLEAASRSTSRSSPTQASISS